MYETKYEISSHAQYLKERVTVAVSRFSPNNCGLCPNNCAALLLHPWNCFFQKRREYPEQYDVVRVSARESVGPSAALL